MSLLLDTNVMAELRKQRPQQRVLAWFDAVSSCQLYLSVLVLGEGAAGGRAAESARSAPGGRP